MNQTTSIGTINRYYLRFSYEGGVFQHPDLFNLTQEQARELRRHNRRQEVGGLLGKLIDYDSANRQQAGEPAKNPPFNASDIEGKLPNEISNLVVSLLRENV